MNETAILVTDATNGAWHIPHSSALTFCGVPRPLAGWLHVSPVEKAYGQVCPDCIKEKERSMYVNQR